MKAMPAPFVSTRPAMSRRQFLRGAGIMLALPLLDSMTPAFAAAKKNLKKAAAPRRMLGICNNLGLLPEQFLPGGSRTRLHPLALP